MSETEEGPFRTLRIIIYLIAITMLASFFGGIFLVAYYNTVLGVAQQYGGTMIEDVAVRILSLIVLSLEFYLILDIPFIIFSIYLIKLRGFLEGTWTVYLGGALVTIGVLGQLVPLMYIMTHANEILGVFMRGFVFMARIGEIFLGTIWGIERIFPHDIMVLDLVSKILITIGLVFSLYSLTKMLAKYEYFENQKVLVLVISLILCINLAGNFVPLVFFITRLALFLAFIVFAYMLTE